MFNSTGADQQASGASATSPARPPYGFPMTPGPESLSDRASRSERMPPPKAVVVDTNLWSNGILDAGKLAGHAERLAKSGITVWVPEVVILEWASHAAADLNLAIPPLRRLFRSRLIEDQTPEAVDPETLVRQITTMLRTIPNVKIIENRAQSALAGLRDQILGTGAGTTVSGIKTGAADSAWVRDVLHETDDAASLVFMTKNAKDVHRTAASLALPPLRVCDERSLYTTIFQSTADSTNMLHLITDHLLALESAGPTRGYQVWPPEPWILIPDLTISNSAFDPDDPFEVTDVLVDSNPLLVGISNLRTLDTKIDDQAATATFDVHLLTEVTVVGYRPEPDGTIQTVSTKLPATLIKASLVADIRDLHVKQLSTQGSAIARPALWRFQDGDDARNELSDFFDELSGVAIADGLELLEDETELVGPTGRRVQVLDASGYDDEWSMDFSFDGRRLSIDCQYDPAGRIWAGRDGVDFVPPYILTTDQGETGVWRTVADIWRYLVRT